MSGHTETDPVAQLLSGDLLTKHSFMTFLGVKIAEEHYAEEANEQKQYPTQDFYRILGTAVRYGLSSMFDRNADANIPLVYDRIGQWADVFETGMLQTAAAFELGRELYETEIAPQSPLAQQWASEYLLFESLQPSDSLEG